MKQLSISQEEAAFIYDAIYKGWAVDGKPTAGRTKVGIGARSKRRRLERTAETGADL